MAKLRKISFYLVDIDNTYNDVETITNELERSLDGIVKVIATQESEEIDWHDDIDLNRNDATLEEHEAYLKPSLLARVEKRMADPKLNANFNREVSKGRKVTE